MSKIYGFGLNKSGQLGVGSRTNQPVPQPCQSAEVFTEISAGGLFSCALTDHGRVFSFGSGKSGRLGHGDEEDCLAPKLVAALGSRRVVHLAAGDRHAAAVCDDGDVYTWGYAGRSGSGHGSLERDCLVPRRVEAMRGRRVCRVACGNSTTAFITDAGELLMCGRFAGLGDGGAPYVVPGLDGKRVTAVAIGFRHALIVADDVVYAWGTSKDGALGLGAVTTAAVPTPIASLSGRGVCRVACNFGEHHTHSAAVTADGNLYTFGSGYKGKLGHGTTDDVREPRRVESLAGRVVDVAAGGIHCGALTGDGVLYTFGCGSDGRLGHPEQAGHRYLYKEFAPRAVDAFAGRRVTRLAFSYYHSLALV
eukprot:TRINITY_DN2133_c0_g1_i1.p1 TRINITY_DN2133_c0_g1~~TRINITY_DN2133_c0_g1_i1.p1  ORF type:complete len:364 (+),score=83.84 TRINITY_DN2133_c0_g1_i1:94-1185(+)